MIKTKKLSSQRSVTYGFFGSKGGVSKGIYKSLNCGIGSNDKKNNIKKNLNIVLKKLKSNTKKIHLPKSKKDSPNKKFLKRHRDKFK